MSPSNLNRKTVVCVVTSEATWHNLARYCFNLPFKLNRHRFDLAVICNGSADPVNAYLRTFKPEYLLNRPNLGFDLAGFDMLLRQIPTEPYNRFILLHDDHWFEDENWFDTLSDLADSHPEIDIFGNLLDCSKDKLVEHFEIVSRILGYGRYLEPMPPVFVQGVAGLFTRRAIMAWQQADGIPHIHTNLKNVAEICERLASFILYHAGCHFMQFPPGFQQYLRHGSHISHCLEAPHTIYRSPHKAAARNSEAVPPAEAIQFFADLTKTACSIKVGIFASRLDVIALLRTMPRHQLHQICFFVVAEIPLLEEQLDGLRVNCIVASNAVQTSIDAAALSATMDYVITDISEIAQNASALDRVVFYAPNSLQDELALKYEAYRQITILANSATFTASDRYLAISLALLHHLVSRPAVMLSADERRVNDEIQDRISHHSASTDSNLLSLLDTNTPVFKDLGIETTTVCNMSCPYCPNSTIGRPASYMPDTTFYKIIDSTADFSPNYSGSISPHFYGEPLIDNRLELFVRYAKKRLPQASVQLFTNGVLLDLERFLTLVEAGVDKFVISQHTAEPLPSLINTLKAINTNYPDHAQIEYFDQYHANTKMNRGGLLPGNKPTSAQFYRCNQYKALCFDVTGTAVLCCNDYLSSETFGSIQHYSVQEIWTNAKYRRIRNLLHYSYFPLPICQNCAFI